VFYSNYKFEYLCYRIDWVRWAEPLCCTGDCDNILA